LVFGASPGGESIEVRLETSAAVSGLILIDQTTELAARPLSNLAKLLGRPAIPRAELGGFHF
jgi:hypothetical protein